MLDSNDHFELLWKEREELKDRANAEEGRSYEAKKEFLRLTLVGCSGGLVVALGSMSSDVLLVGVIFSFSALSFALGLLQAMNSYRELWIFHAIMSAELNKYITSLMQYRSNVNFGRIKDVDKSSFSPKIIAADDNAGIKNIPAAQGFLFFGASMLGLGIFIREYGPLLDKINLRGLF